MNPYADLVDIMQGIANNVYDSLAPTDVVTLELVSISPLTFRKSIELELDDEIVIPRGICFSGADVGKRYVFMKNADGQEYYFLYERA